MIRRSFSAARLAALALLALALGGPGCATSGYHTKPQVAVVDADPIVQMVSSSKFRPLVDPKTVPLRKHTDPPFSGEEAVGRSDLTPPRIYPVGLLDGPEVLNDDADGAPYVVARCALTDLVAIYDRRVDGRTLTFENSGALWRDMLVMRDKETGTYWTPATGRALHGPLEGRTLSAIPAPIAKAGDWKESDPELLCLDTGEMSSVSLQMKLYGKSPMEGLSGGKSTDPRYEPKQRVYYVASESGDAAAAISSEELRRRKTWTPELAGRHVTFEWDAGLRTPRAYAEESGKRREVAVIPIYWFAAQEHFRTVVTPESAAKAR
ncbi:MAG TPA: DUF3179 domain-containing (seleno)protein [Thermoanaerobaculia bacterium]|nr:DUF3179 domain-containing (seleno)protein [Thermoanaerobaculia bacterium]